MSAVDVRVLSFVTILGSSWDTAVGNAKSDRERNIGAIRTSLIPTLDSSSNRVENDCQVSGERKNMLLETKYSYGKI